MPAWAAMALQSLAPTLWTPGLAQTCKASPAAAEAPGIRPKVAAAPMPAAVYMNARRVQSCWFIDFLPFWYQLNAFIACSLPIAWFTGNCTANLDTYFA
jgi:hypothetical protein